MSAPPSLVAVVVPDDPTVWSGAGFTVQDATVELGPLTVVCAGRGAEPALAFDRPHPEGRSDLDGIPWRVTPIDDGPRWSAPHPNGVDGFDHLVIMAADEERVAGAIVAAGLEIRRRRETTMAGAPIVQLFAFAGGVLLEVVAPAADGSGGPEVWGGSQIWGLAATATDLDLTVGRLGDRVGAARAAVQAGRRIAPLRHADLGMAFTFAVMTPRSDGSRPDPPAGEITPKWVEVPKKST